MDLRHCLGIIDMELNSVLYYFHNSFFKYGVKIMDIQAISFTKILHLPITWFD